jgi:hypothetical protein
MAQHTVTAPDIQAAARERDFWPDAALIYLPVGVLFFFVAARLCRRLLARRALPGERWTTVVTFAWTGLTASFIATLAAHLHSWNVDAARLRNFHMSFRASYLPIGMHPWLAYLIALLVFALAGSRELRRSLRPDKA